jgi:signal transduction histidine kinase
VALIKTPSQNGLAMRLPLYRSDMPATTVAERRAAYIGSVGMGFGINRLVQGVLHEMPIKPTHLHLLDLAVGSPGPDEPKQVRLLFDGDEKNFNAVDRGSGRSDRFFYASYPIDFNQRPWRADFSVPKSAMYSQFDAYYPWLAMVAGCLTTGLLYALFQTLATSRKRAVAMANEMTRELRSSQEKLQASHLSLRRLVAHADQIKEIERKRIAREIHDDLGQNLLALRIDAEMLAARTNGTQSRLHERASATLKHIDGIIKSVRQIINDLRPNVLDLGLNAAVDWQLTQFQLRTGIECELLENENELHLDDHIATALFRILQESLSNISRHSRATHVRIELHVLNNWLTMTVTDNGIGLQQGGRDKHGSFGLVGIEERVNILGGTFSVSSEPGAGATLVTTVPLTQANRGLQGDTFQAPREMGTVG